MSYNKSNWLSTIAYIELVISMNKTIPYRIVHWIAFLLAANRILFAKLLWIVCKAVKIHWLDDLFCVDIFILWCDLRLNFTFSFSFGLEGFEANGKSRIIYSADKTLEEFLCFERLLCFRHGFWTTDSFYFEVCHILLSAVWPTTWDECRSFYLIETTQLALRSRYYCFQQRLIIILLLKYE